MAPHDGDIVERAESEELDGDGLEELASVLTDVVIVRLMRAGTVAARVNLLAVRADIRPVRRDVGAIREEKRRDAEETAREVRALGLPFGVTHHAVEQFATRFGMSIDEVFEHARQAVPTKDHTRMGEVIWVCPEGIRFVIRRDRVTRENLCVTVLPDRREPITNRRGRRPRRWEQT